MNNVSRAQVLGYKGYTELELGNINILLSVPHDGALRPVDIPDRSDPLGNVLRDSNTRNFAQVLRDELSSLLSSQYGYNVKLFVVYNNLHRIKMDPNREPNCSCSNEESSKAYTEYHSMIQTYFRTNFLMAGQKKFKQALLIDIHGQAHPENRIELGYLLTPHQLNADMLSNLYLSSIHSLHRSNAYSMEALIRGSVSFGAVLNKFGMAAVPSPATPRPYASNYYYGGYISKYHCALTDQNSNINCIQSELPASMRAGASYASHAKLYAKAVFEFYKLHSFYN